MSMRRRLREVKHPPGRFNLHQSGGTWHTSNPLAYLLFLLIDGVAQFVALLVVIASEPFYMLGRRLTPRQQAANDGNRRRGRARQGRRHR